MAKGAFLFDVNTLLALTEDEHEHHKLVMKWFQSTIPKEWGVCPFTEAGFLRLAANPKVGAHTIEEAEAVLTSITALPGFRFWPVSDRWATLTAPFSTRLFGHQQITDAYLLGLAIMENGTLVTLDKAIKYLAGPKFHQHVLLLQ